jgi:pimeloyl-ACP methyl ester carboxylesterase
MKSAPNSPDDVDPRTSLIGASIPALWIFGGKDTSIPADLSVSRLEGLIAQGRTNFEYKVFPEGGHKLAGSKDPRYPYMTRWIESTAAKLTADAK